jgi:hypothetical protein
MRPSDESGEARLTPSPATSPKMSERRRLLRGGLAATPVLMTIASRPVLGSTVCQAASVTTSVQPSGNRPVTICSGLTPEQWKAAASSWPSPYYGGTTDSTTTTDTAGTTAATGTVTKTASRRDMTTGAITTTTTTTSGTTTTSTSTPGSAQATPYHCPTTGLGGRVYANKSMLEVLDVTQGGRNLDSLGRYIVAALLNARAGRTPVLSESNVRSMWNDIVNRGYYEPTAGVRWTPAEIVAYIRTTMG